MATVDIYFAGLINIQGPDPQEGTDRIEKVIARLIDDGEHQAYITVKSNQGTTKLKEGTVTFLGLSTDHPKAGKLFTDEQHVPHLDDLTMSGVELKTKKTKRDVILPGGTLTVARFYKNKASYTIDTSRYVTCVALVTRLIADMTAARAFVNFNGMTIEIPPGGWVLIENAATAHPSDEGGHWKLNRLVTTASTDDEIATYHDTGEDDFALPCMTTPEPGKDFESEVLPNIQAVSTLVAALQGKKGKQEEKHAHIHSAAVTTGEPDATHSECANTQWP